MARNILLLAECIFLYVGVPIVLRLGWLHVNWFLVLGVVAAAMVLWLLRHERFRPSRLWRGDDVHQERRQLRRVLLRFVVCAAALMMLVLSFHPEKLFQLPLESPLLWAAILLLYPLLSVYPQELVYRTFFTRRYQPLFSRLHLLIAASALVFGYMHLIYRNPLAVGLTLIGGWFFAETYARTGSLRLVCLEHALYENLIFTIGLGEYFYHGRIPQA
jgi:membrane protease YdiL (CAAX protease family)